MSPGLSDLAVEAKVNVRTMLRQRKLHNMMSMEDFCDGAAKGVVWAVRRTSELVLRRKEAGEEERRGWLVGVLRALRRILKANSRMHVRSYRKREANDNGWLPVHCTNRSP
jgi:hypothetical protein